MTPHTTTDYPTLYLPTQNNTNELSENTDSCIHNLDISPRNIQTDPAMSTVEYAVGTIAAAAFGGILYKIVTGSSVINALTDLINRALTSVG